MKKNQICAAIALCLTSLVNAEQTYNYEGSTGLIVPKNVGLVNLSYQQGEKRSENDCRKNIHFEKKKPKVTFLTKESGSINYIDEDPQEYFLGLQSAKISGQYLELDLVSVGLHPEKTGVVYKEVRDESYEGQPGVALIGTVLLAGLPLLFSPKDTVQSAVGCTDITDLEKFFKSSNTDKSTGKTVLRNENGTFEIKLSGFDKETTFTVQAQNSNSAKINLGTLIANATLNGPSEIVVECVNCSTTNEESTKKYGSTTNLINTSADFRSVQQKIIQNERIRIAEENKVRDQELRAKRAEEERMRRVEVAAQDAKHKREAEEQERNRQQAKNQQLQNM